jgi:hypothetical protein
VPRPQSATASPAGGSPHSPGPQPDSHTAAQPSDFNFEIVVYLYANMQFVFNKLRIAGLNHEEEVQWYN